MSKTFTTGQASVALGFMVNAAFIKKMGLEPAGSVKGNPVWAMSDWPALLGGIRDHLTGLNEPGEKPAAPAKKTKVPASGHPPYSDDDSNVDDL